MTVPQQFPIARESAGVAPPRRPGSIRRTTSIDTDWSAGIEQPRTMIGLARDLLTPFDGAPKVLAQASFRLIVTPRREIRLIESSPEHPRMGELIGVQAGNPQRSSRAQIAHVLGDSAGTPLFQLIDDYSGASLVAAWGLMQWDKDSGLPARSGAGPSMANICIGHAEGSSALNSDGTSNFEHQSRTPVGSLEDPADPMGWHAMPAQAGPGARRARRIDLWRDGADICVDAGFQDSAPLPDGTRVAVHEYRVRAKIDAEGVLRAVTAEPLVLPYAECPASVLHVGRLIGQPVARLRDIVPVELATTLGCTHLNDVLRALADVPSLARHLPFEELAAR